MKPQTPVQRARERVMASIQQWGDARVRMAEYDKVHMGSVKQTLAATQLMKEALAAYARAIRAEERKQR